jgi:hypothetical protein
MENRSWGRELTFAPLVLEGAHPRHPEVNGDSRASAPYIVFQALHYGVPADRIVCRLVCPEVFPGNLSTDCSLYLLVAELQLARRCKLTRIRNRKCVPSPLGACVASWRNRISLVGWIWTKAHTAVHADIIIIHNVSSDMWSRIEGNHKSIRSILSAYETWALD